MITIVDYGIGNLRSIEKAFEHVGAQVLRTDCPHDIAAARRLVLPGVGAFGACINEVRRRDLEAPMREALARGARFLGVCVGMQMLFEASEERGIHQGLGILPGRIIRFRHAYGEGSPIKVPHMGWNALNARRPSPLLRGVKPAAYCYFVHSYHAAPATNDCVVATCSYGLEFPAIVASKNVFGLQFHPEKSQHNGLRMLRNFVDMPN